MENLVDFYTSVNSIGYYRGYTEEMGRLSARKQFAALESEQKQHKLNQLIKDGYYIINPFNQLVRNPNHPYLEGWN